MSTELRALTLWQPWASAMFLGLKTFETRSWPTKHRGPVAIHASARPVKAGEIGGLMKLDLQDAGVVGNVVLALPLGVVLGTVDLIHCDKMAEDFDVSPLERRWGLWSAGRYAWRCVVVERFEVPIPATGHQGIWRWQRP